MSSPVSYLDPVQLRSDLGLRDLSEPAAGPHAIQILIGQAVEGLSRAWGCEVRWCSGPRIVPVTDNYDRLGYPAEAITRDTRYTRYVDADRMLRSHASAMIPRALRRLARQPGDDVLLVCPGMVYRRDAIDWQHTGTPHQLDLWRITGRAMGTTDMDQMIAVLGAKPGQKNLLVRVVLRDLEKTLTNQNANALRDRIYRALPQGTHYQWAVNDPSPNAGAMVTRESSPQ